MRSATRNKTGKDPDYLAFIRDLPCLMCLASAEAVRASQFELNFAGWLGRSRVQATPTEAAHVGDRGLSQKCPDRETIPLCAQHHREGKDSAHRLGRNFWKHWGLDRDTLIEVLQQKYTAQAGELMPERVPLIDTNEEMSI